ncbi:MAG: sugar ABC transporter permease [Roseburia sp.]|nr:sugar ABC transporter permease [Roseburia sp.]
MAKKKEGFVKKVPLKKRIIKDLRWNWILYLMIIPVIAYYITFAYRPMYGIIMAFKDYKVKAGILGSEWVGLKHFKRFFSAYNFKDLLKNTWTLSSYSLLASFPIPIIFALILNYSTRPGLKKSVQMISYAPNFISTVVICGMLRLFMSSDGIFNIVLGMLGAEEVSFLSVPEWFKHIYVWSGVWQSMGWSAIIYISALSGVDYALHEAAIIDGATIMQRIRHVDLPSIKSTIVMLLIMSIPGLVGVGFEKVYLLQNDLNITASSVISTYVYEQGMLGANYSYSTAVGLFNTVLSVILLVSANTFCKKVLDESIF